ncbi:MAG TPA: zinc ribbon domain-containing protein [Polyangia bacterium]
MKEQILSAGNPARTTESAAAASDASSNARRRARRRVPVLATGLGGGVIALGYGVGVMHMRFGPPLVMLGLGGLTLVLSGIALWRMLDPLSRAELAAQAVAPRSSGRLKELEREKQLVLKAIKEVELDYQMRKIAEPDYKEMVERYRTRALRLIGELEAGDNFRPLIERELRDRVVIAEATVAPESPAPRAESAADAAPAQEQLQLAAGVCKSCGARNDDDAQFCKRCGEKLKSS